MTYFEAPSTPGRPTADRFHAYRTSPELPAPADPPRKRRGIGGTLLAALALIAKFAAKLKGLLLILPKAKLLTTSASMLVSVAAYALIWGWRFGVGFVLLLLVHELGHVFQLRREGVRATAPMFIPFLGAVIWNREMPRDAGAEARVGLAGPILGSLGSLIPLGIYAATGSDFWRALAFVGFFLNLINLLPVLPLDGGRAMAALSPWMWLVGFVLLIGGSILFPTPIALLVILFGGMETYRRWKTRKEPGQRAYYSVGKRTRAVIAVSYIGLALLLAFGMHATHLVRHL